MKIQSMFADDINRKINGVIKVDQVDSTTEHEVREYVITVEVYEESSGAYTRKASFVCNNVYYSLKGQIEQDVFENIVNNLNFL